MRTVHFALTLFTIATAGCASYRQELASLPIRTPALPPSAARAAKHIVLVAFDDQRGPEWIRESPERFIPVAHWFHGRAQTFYPEQMGVLWRHVGGHRTTLAGSMATAMPTLLQTAMKQMGIADRTTVGVSNDPTADYVVTGRIKRTRFRTDLVPVAAAALGLFGVPWGVSRYDLEYEVALYDAHDLATPIFSRTYDWSGKRTLGAYYNQEWAYRLFLNGLESTLPSVIGDLATALAARG